MTQADKIRQFALDHYVVPARAKGLALVTIRAGDIHREMNLANAMPAVCSAIGSNKFEQMAGVQSISKTGPAKRANVYFEFGLAARPLPKAATPVTDAPPRTTPPRDEGKLDLDDALVLVACVKSKRARPSSARPTSASTRAPSAAPRRSERSRVFPVTYKV